MSRQTNLFHSFSTAVIACALLACGDAKNLSVGEVRCEGVSCEPIQIAPVEVEHIEVEHIERDEQLVPVIGQQPFCDGIGLSELRDESVSDTSCIANTLVAVGEDQFVVATKYVTGFDTERAQSGVLLAGYTGDQLQWESTELSREVALVANYFGDSYAIARGAAPGEAIVGITRETGAYSAYGQAFYSIKRDGELTELFEDDKAGRINALAAIGEDIVVVTDYERRVELTRYTTEGIIVWRQVTLTLGEEVRSDFPTRLGSAALQVLDGERIVVLVPREHSYQLVELTGEGELVRSWLNTGNSDPIGVSTTGARLETGLRGQFVVGIDGYDINRGSLEGEGPRVERFFKDRTQYYTPAVQGLHVDRAGYIYIVTIDGTRDERYGLLERISPDLSRRESFVIDDEEDGYLVNGELFVTGDQRTLYFVSNGTIGSIELPPID